MHHAGLYAAQELKQEIKPLPAEYGRSGVHHPAMHHPSAWNPPPVTGAYLGMGSNSGKNRRKYSQIVNPQEMNIFRIRGKYNQLETMQNKTKFFLPMEVSQYSSRT